jgi:uncharacterized LabA/DUF88 family protein
MGKKTVVMIDGGHLRALTKLVHKTYDPNLIEKYALACPTADEELVRILYYDCAPYNGTQSQPISKTRKKFEASDAWLKVLAERPLFAVRVGQLKFRGFALDSVPIHPNPLSDANFRPVFDQKGVDMRIGLDIAAYSAGRWFDRIALVIGDTDLIPAMKLARRSGLQVVLIQVGANHLAPELFRHSDFVRSVPLP